MILRASQRLYGFRESAGVAGLYLVCWVVMAWPTALGFRTHYWMDEGDGLQMIWNLWHASHHPSELLHGSCVFFPRGFAPLLHSYHPLTSWIVGWLPIDLVLRFNLAILLTFVGTGLTTYWLCRYVGASRWGALIGGFAFAFTEYRWAHAQGHLNLISTQFVPLFCLAWLQTLEKPDWRRSGFAAASLLAVLLSDHYLASYCVLFALIMWLARPRDPRTLWRFLLLAGASSGALVMALWNLHTTEQYLGAHSPRAAPMDLLALFVPGAHWRFASWTEPIWSNFPGNIHESGVHLGIGLWLAILIRPRRSAWWLVLLAFGLFALGERLVVLGRESPIPLPYGLLSSALPPVALGGVPVRMAVMVALASAVLGAHAFTRLGRPGYALALLLLLELLPSPPARHQRPHEDWSRAIAAHEGDGALLDLLSDPHYALYEQTLHERPVFAARLARRPADLLEREAELWQLENGAQWSTLRNLGFGYLRTLREHPELELVHEDASLRTYYLPEPGDSDR